MKMELVSPLLVLSLYWLCLCSHVFVVSGLCLDDQKSFLLQFKNNITFRSNTSLNSWNASDECCSWVGVTCDNEGHVTDLELPSESISAGVESLSTLFSLQHLRYLNLSANYFTGPMPSSYFEGLHNLDCIDLSYNSFTGRIPSSLFTLPFMTIIQLSHNQFSQVDEFINVSSSMLDIVDLSSNNLSGSFPTFNIQNSELRYLTILDLSYNNLSVNVNVGPSPFPSVDYLYLASCNLKTFPAFLRNLSELKTLDLSDNQIQGIVPNWIWKQFYLESLNISHNLFTDLEGPLPDTASSLRSLDLHHNLLQGPIPNFAKYAFLLDFSSNKFSSIIPQDIGDHLYCAAFLSLSNNTLHGTIPDSLCNVSYLGVLDLSLNNISGTIPSCLMNKTLEILNLKNNNLLGPIPDTLPASCRLWSLNIHGNLLDGPIPKSLAYCSNLEVLNLGSNQITGGFPCFLKKISTLRVLVLRNNKFQGPLICSNATNNWEMLQIVDIAYNNFSGKLPGKYFTNWKRNDQSKYIEKELYFNNFYYEDVTVISKGLQMELVKILTIFTSIDFSSNHFEGPIPEDLMEFKALYALNLSNNVLSGEIPSSIGNLRLLESFDLSQNFFSGKIPMQLASLSFLSYLNLSFNHLVGKIPTSTQLQSFPASSFEGNDGLYGPPLTQNPDGKKPRVLPQPKCGRLSCTIDWNFISVELGLIFGHGIVFGSLLIWKRWRVFYWQLVHKILCWIFPRMYLEYVIHRGQSYETLRWRH